MLSGRVFCAWISSTPMLHVQNPYDQDKHYVMKIVPRDLFKMSNEVESNLPQKTIIDVPSEEFFTQQLKVEYEEEFEDEFEDESENEYEDGFEAESNEQFKDDAP
ncbi:hypothetical protein H5410_061163 [Solanum commersonii]|uniref:Uncharacterized protein n=1 Tax=Solanum commersonii TaxID=4109 RepID=A0A9J5W703_SOLCO|nr:hypothetical protein H5410_061163 [Solanum commersonii]